MKGLLVAVARGRAEWCGGRGPPLAKICCEGERRILSGAVEASALAPDAERSCMGRPNGSHAKLCGRFRVPKPKRRGGCPNDVRRTESRTATAVTPSRLQDGRQLGCRAEAGPHQLQREVRPRRRYSSIYTVSNWCSRKSPTPRRCFIRYKMLISVVRHGSTSVRVGRYACL